MIDPLTGDLYTDERGETIGRYSFNASGEVIEPNSVPCVEECAPTEVVASGVSDGRGIGVDAAKQVYVDQGEQLLEFDPSGTRIGTPIGSGLLGESSGLAVDSVGNIFAGNERRGNIYEFGPYQLNPDPRADNPLVIDAVGSPANSSYR